MRLTDVDKRVLAVLKIARTFPELADALSVNGDKRRRTLDGRLQAMVREGLIVKYPGAAYVEGEQRAGYQVTSAGSRRLAAVLAADRARRGANRVPPRPFNESRGDW
jgi:hypothetical protein